MAEGDVHTEPYKEGWANRVEGNKRVSSTHETKIAAQKHGRDMAMVREVDHFIHDRSGKIIERTSYGNDPPRGPD